MQNTTIFEPVTEQIVDPIIIIFAANFKILKNETK